MTTAMEGAGSTVTCCPHERHVVLVAPEIHWNTGNIGRTVLAAGAVLHLVRPLGFRLDSRQIRRAGLDYWERVPLSVWNDFDAFLAAMAPTSAELALYSRAGVNDYRKLKPGGRLFLVFGSESEGLPEKILASRRECTYRIPITADIRSLNLSTTVGIALYQSLLEVPDFHAWPPLPKGKRA